MRKHVHVLIGWHNPRIIQGFCRYAHLANWHLDILSLMTGIISRERRGDGVLMTNAHTPEMKRLMLELVASKMPCVLHGPNELGVDIPTSETDEEAIGQLAAEHLLEHGHKKFVVFASGNSEHARSRFEGFSRTVAKRGYPVHYLHFRSSRLDSLGAWLMAELATLTRPLGLFAIDDILAAEAIEAAHASGWRIPEDLAVIGVGNHPAACEYSRVPITSVEMPTEEQAYQAARMLDDLMNGRPLANRHVVLPPIGVITRRSSDYLAITHAQVRKAVDYIQHHAFDQTLSLPAVAQAANASLSNLYNLFR
ncbi:MAG: substrate-binding domain-containing protein, partial [bacterium]